MSKRSSHNEEQFCGHVVAAVLLRDQLCNQLSNIFFPHSLEAAQFLPPFLSVQNYCWAGIGSCCPGCRRWTTTRCGSWWVTWASWPVRWTRTWCPSSTWPPSGDPTYSPWTARQDTWAGSSPDYCGSGPFFGRIPILLLYIEVFFPSFPSWET